ncbi:MAG TPA: hypothetical protein PKD53_18520 [Chloroflexaceae bacterium]|nr:hypothetical protein [Chloroflexaceae bacterium]
MTRTWQPNHLRPRAAWSDVHIRAYSLRVADRLGGVGGSAVLRAIRAVSSASRARGQSL